MSDYVKQPDGTMAPTPEHIADLVRRYVQQLNLGLNKAATLRSTPLDNVIRDGLTVTATYTASDTFVTPYQTFCFDSHLRTALIHACLRADGVYGPSVVVRDPIMLMSDLMENGEAPRLLNCDVLVVLAVAFPYYAAAQQHIGNLLRTRHGLGRCSIFAKPDTYQLLNRAEKALDPEFVSFMGNADLVGNLLLREDDLPNLIVKLNDADIPGFTPKALSRKRRK